jgi:raffinose/stachyose/melibiose transport system substrate-binding protein
MAKLTRREFLHRASFVTAGGLLAACVAPAAPAAEGDGAAAPMEEMLELRVGAIAGIVTEGLQALADLYMDENPNISVSIDVLAEEQYQQAFLLFSSDDTPDVSWYQCVPANRFNDMVTSQILVPLDDLYEQEGWFDAYPEGIVDFQRQPDGHYYSATSSVVWTPYTYYNKEIFEEVSVTPPETWDDLYAMSSELRDAGYQPLTVDYNMGIQSHFSDGMQLRSWSRDQYNCMPIKWRADAPASCDQYTWTDPDSVRIYEYIKAMVDNGVFVDGVTGLTEYQTGRSLFTTGKAAMWQTGSWDGGAAGLSRDVEFELGYFYYPEIRPERTGKVGAWVPDGLIVPKSGQNIEASLEFLAWAYRLPQASLYAQTAGIPHGRADIPSEVYSEILSEMQLQFLEDNKEYGTPALFEASSNQPYQQATVKSVDQMMAGGLTPAEAGAWLQEKTEEIRAEQS